MLYSGIIKNTNMKNKIDFDKLKWYWYDKPLCSTDKLLDHEGERQFTKGEFWQSHGTSKYGKLISGHIGPDGTWRFEWEYGDVSGFVEGEDFTF
jgi:hypothetical protein